jgi:hypothetical protein
MDFYTPDLMWFDQNRTMTVECLSCKWIENGSSIAAARAHALAHDWHTVAVTHRITTHIRRLRSRAASDVAA